MRHVGSQPPNQGLNPHLRIGGLNPWTTGEVPCKLSVSKEQMIGLGRWSHRMETWGFFCFLLGGSPTSSLSSRKPGPCPLFLTDWKQQGDSPKAGWFGFCYFHPGCLEIVWNFSPPNPRPNPRWSFFSHCWGYGQPTWHVARSWTTCSPISPKENFCAGDREFPEWSSSKTNCPEPRWWVASPVLSSLLPWGWCQVLARSLRQLRFLVLASECPQEMQANGR